MACLEGKRQLGVHHLQPAPEDPLKQLPLAPQAPHLEVDVVIGVGHDFDQPRAGVHLDVAHRPAVAAIEGVGHLQQGDQPGDPVAVRAREAPA